MPRRAVPGASGRSLFLFLTFLSHVNPLFPHPLHSPHPSSVSLAGRERRSRFSEPRTSKRGRYCYRIDTSLVRRVGRGRKSGRRLREEAEEEIEVKKRMARFVPLGCS